MHISLYRTNFDTHDFALCCFHCEPSTPKEVQKVYKNAIIQHNWASALKFTSEQKPNAMWGEDVDLLVALLIGLDFVYYRELNMSPSKNDPWKRKIKTTSFHYIQAKIFLKYSQKSMSVCLLRRKKKPQYIYSNINKKFLGNPMEINTSISFLICLYIINQKNVCASDGYELMFVV